MTFRLKYIRKIEKALSVMKVGSVTEPILFKPPHKALNKCTKARYVTCHLDLQRGCHSTSSKDFLLLFQSRHLYEYQILKKKT